MQLIRLTINHDTIIVAYYPVDDQTATARFSITLDPQHSFSENLDHLKARLAGLKVTAAILESSLTYPFSDTIISFNGTRVDAGLALTDCLNIPVVSQTAVDRDGLIKAVKAKTAYLDWHLDYYGQAQASRSHGQEAMLTVGNGYFGLRGADVESHADDDHFQHLTANIVGNLLVHLFPYLPGQAAVARQHPAYGVKHLLFIFQQKENHQRNQHQVDRQRQQPDQGGQRIFHHRIADG